MDVDNHAIATTYEKDMSKSFAILVIVLQIVFYASFLKRAEIKTSDFPTYYSVARLWQENKQPYDLDNQCAEESKIINNCFPLAHPPFLLLLLGPFVNENFTASFWRWIVVLSIITLLCVAPLYYLSKDLSGASQSILLYATVLAIFYGNDGPFVLLAICLWVWLMDQRADRWAGWVLALALLKPQFAVILAVPLLFSRWRVFLGFCEAAVLLVLFSFLLVGREGFEGIIHITRVMAEGKGYGIGQMGMINVTGVFVRAGMSPLWSWGFYLLAIGFLSWLWRKYGLTRETVSIGIVCALFFAPHSHVYDLALLAIPLLFAHRLAPMIGSMVMVLTIPLHVGYYGAFILFVPLVAWNISRLSSQYAPTRAPHRLSSPPLT